MSALPRRKKIVTTRLLSPQKIEYAKFFFQKSLFTTNTKKMLSEQTNFLGTLHIPKLSDDESLLFERELTESELYDTLKNVPNNRSPGNGGLKK